MSTAYIVAAVRTAGARKAGRLSGWHPADLAARVLDALIERTHADPALVDDVIMGCVSQVGEQAGNVARNAVLSSKLPQSVPGTSVDRHCGSSQQAIHFAAQAVMSGAMDVVIAAGVESMSRVPMGLSTQLPAKNGFGTPVGESMAARFPGVQFSQFAGAEMMAKYIFLKTGAYRPADLALALAFASKFRLDLLTVDGAGGGTGMSPWHMMNEWGVPPVELHSLLYQYARYLAGKKKYVPALAVNGGFTFEDQIFKGLAMGAPFVKLVGMARGPIEAAMVGKTIGRAIENQQIPVYIERFGHTKDEIFVTASSLRKELGDAEFGNIPPGALGLYTYYERLAQGLRQLYMSPNTTSASVLP